MKYLGEKSMLVNNFLNFGEAVTVMLVKTFLYVGEITNIQFHTHSTTYYFTAYIFEKTLENNDF